MTNVYKVVLLVWRDGSDARDRVLRYVIASAYEQVLAYLSDDVSRFDARIGSIEWLGAAEYAIAVDDRGQSAPTGGGADVGIRG